VRWLTEVDFGDFISHEPELVIRHGTYVDAATKRDELRGNARAASGGGGEFRCALLLAVRSIMLSANTLREPVQANGVESALSRQ